MKNEADSFQNQFAMMFSRSTAECLLDNIKGSKPDDVWQTEAQRIRDFLESFDTPDIAHNAAAMQYCLENSLPIEGYSASDLQHLAKLTMEVYTAQQAEIK